MCSTNQAEPSVALWTVTKEAPANSFSPLQLGFSLRPKNQRPRWGHPGTAWPPPSTSRNSCTMQIYKKIIFSLLQTFPSRCLNISGSSCICLNRAADLLTPNERNWTAAFCCFGLDKYSKNKHSGSARRPRFVRPGHSGSGEWVLSALARHSAASCLTFSTSSFTFTTTRQWYPKIDSLTLTCARAHACRIYTRARARLQSLLRIIFHILSHTIFSPWCSSLLLPAPGLSYAIAGDVSHTISRRQKRGSASNALIHGQNWLITTVSDIFVLVDFHIRIHQSLGDLYVIISYFPELFPRLLIATCHLTSCV